MINLAIQSIALTLLLHPLLFWFPKMLPFLKLGETIYDPCFPIRKLSGFQAGLLKNWKEKINWLTTERSKRVSQYVVSLKEIEGLTIIADPDQTDSISCIRFPITIQNVSTVKKIIALSEKLGYGIAKSYPDTIDTIESNEVLTDINYPNAKKIVNTLLTLPCHPLVTNKDIRKISKLLQSNCQNSD